MPKDQLVLADAPGLPPQGGRPSFIWALLVGALVLALGAFGTLWWRQGRSPILSLPGDLQDWSSLPQKQALAGYLDRNVLVPGFSVAVVAVKARQNYWSLAKSAKVNINSIIGFNPDLKGLDAYTGQPLLLPHERGALYQVVAGDTLASVVQRFKLKPGEIKDDNRVGWRGLDPGQVLFLPDIAPDELTPTMRQLIAQRDFIRSPLAGHFTSMMGERVDPFTGVIRFHNGVDIGAPFNTPVGAAAAGTVVLAGWNGGFGRCIIIRHAEGYRTLYGHLNQILVHVGEKVRQHQIIGRVGMTGRTTGPHLHFTIWHNGRLQDPLKYLW